jgi:hypothetical protein
MNYLQSTERLSSLKEVNHDFDRMSAYEKGNKIGDVKSKKGKQEMRRHKYGQEELQKNGGGNNNFCSKSTAVMSAVLQEI